MRLDMFEAAPLTKIRALLILCLAWAAPWPVLGQQTAEQWLAQVDRTLNPPQYEAYRKLINLEPDGSKKEFVLYTLKQGHDKVAVLFLSPATDKGRATLRVGENMWLYIPEVGRPLRITSLQSVTGGVFNNADIMQVDYRSEYEAVELIATDESGPSGEKLLQLNLKAKGNAVAYDRLEMFIDPQLKSPVRIRAIAASGLLVKTMHFKNIKDFGQGIRRPSVVETDSPLHRGYKSIVLFARIKPRDLEPQVFSVDYLGRLESLR